MILAACPSPIPPSSLSHAPHPGEGNISNRVELGFEDDLRQAERQLTEMNNQYAFVLGELRSLQRSVRELQGRNFHRKAPQAAHGGTCFQRGCHGRTQVGQRRSPAAGASAVAIQPRHARPAEAAVGQERRPFRCGCGVSTFEPRARGVVGKCSSLSRAQPQPSLAPRKGVRVLSPATNDEALKSSTTPPRRTRSLESKNLEPMVFVSSRLPRKPVKRRASRGLPQTTQSKFSKLDFTTVAEERSARGQGCGKRDNDSVDSYLLGVESGGIQGKDDFDTFGTLDASTLKPLRLDHAVNDMVVSAGLQRDMDMDDRSLTTDGQCDSSIFSISPTASLDSPSGLWKMLDGHHAADVQEPRGDFMLRI